MKEILFFMLSVLLFFKLHILTCYVSFFKILYLHMSVNDVVSLFLLLFLCFSFHKYSDTKQFIFKVLPETKKDRYIEKNGSSSAAGAATMANQLLDKKSFPNLSMKIVTATLCHVLRTHSRIISQHLWSDLFLFYLLYICYQQTNCCSIFFLCV